MQNRPIKFTDTLTDAWYLRTIFTGNTDSVASYKFWIEDRKVRGQDIRYDTDVKFCFMI